MLGGLNSPAFVDHIVIGPWYNHLASIPMGITGRKSFMTPLVVEAIYENGVLKPTRPLPLQEHERVQVTVDTSANVRKAFDAVERSYGLIHWSGSPEDLDYLIHDVENDPLEGQ
jgi:predicted DNA-binding antitoxin AbrB/MazE fold protein